MWFSSVAITLFRMKPVARLATQYSPAWLALLKSNASNAHRSKALSRSVFWANPVHQLAQIFVAAIFVFHFLQTLLEKVMASRRE
jgi:hypothetical protein